MDYEEASQEASIRPPLPLPATYNAIHFSFRVAWLVLVRGNAIGFWAFSKTKSFQVYKTHIHPLASVNQPLTLIVSI